MAATSFSFINGSPNCDHKAGRLVFERPCGGKRRGEGMGETPHTVTWVTDINQQINTLAIGRSSATALGSRADLQHARLGGASLTLTNTARKKGPRTQYAAGQKG